MAQIIGLAGQQGKRRMSDFYGDDWGGFCCSGFLEIGRHREFTGETLRVLFVLLGKLEKDNRLKIYLAEVADELGIRKDRVRVQIKKLVAAGVLIEGRYGWALEPRYGFKGEPDKGLKRGADGSLVLARPYG